MKKIKLFALALMAMFSLNTMAQYSHVGASADTYTFGDATKPGSDTRFTKIADGVYLHRNGTFSASSYGLKTQNNTSGIVLYTETAYDLVATANFQATKNAENVKIVIKSITDAEYDLFFTGTNNSTKVNVSPVAEDSFYVEIQNAKGSYSDTLLNLPAGYHYIVASTSGSNTYFESITLTGGCEAPGTPLALVITPSANLTAGDIVTISTEGGNGNPVSFTLDGNTYSDGPTWTAVAGTHTFAVSQDANAGVCGGDDEVILNVISNSPVTSATVEGSNIGFIGQELTYTVTAENATTYAWYVDGVAQAETSATFVYTAATGDHTIYATATNAYTSDPVQSNTIALTVTKLCGELIKAEHDGTAKGATVTGVIGGTVDKNIAKDGKFGGKGQYFGLTLASGAFAFGDMINVHLTAAGQQGSIAIYSDKNGANLLYDSESIGAVGDNVYMLPAAAAGLSTVYVCRTETNTWNGFVDYISITRPCEASNNADLGKVWCQIGEEAIYFEPEADGITYNIVVPASVPLTEADLQFSLAHPLASSNVSSPIHFTIPAAGAPAETATIVVTAEDGTTQKTYTINVSKSAEADHDATLSSLAVTGYTLVPAFDPAVTSYTITKAYGSANPGTDKIVLERASSVSSSTKEAVGDDLVITVTAEDGTTQVVYTIHIAEAAADKDLLEVAFSNGAKGDIDAANFIITVPYLTGEAAPTYVSAQFASWVEGASAEMVGNDLQVTGADGQTALYTINAVEMFPAPVVLNSDVVFDGSEVYIHAHYGWDSGKGWKMAKYTEEKGNRRISSGNNRMYIALPAAKSVFLTSGSGGAREATITVNGVVSSITKLAGSNDAIQLGLSDTHANFIEVINKGNGDGGFISMQLSDQPTQLGEAKAEDAVKAHKVVRNGQIIIVRGDKEFDLTGAPLN